MTTTIQRMGRGLSLVGPGAAAVMFALGNNSLGYLGIAGAAPNNGGGTSGEWDIGVYDSCMKNHPPFYSDNDKLDWAISCCYSSGGVWGSGGSCVAPAAATGTSSPLAPPARVVPPNMSAPRPPPLPANVSSFPAEYVGSN